MKRFFVVLAIICTVFAVSCGGSSGKQKTDDDQTGISDSDETGDPDVSQEPGDGDSDDIEEPADQEPEPQDTDTPETPDPDTDSTPIDPEATENHKISGAYQAGAEVSGIEAALYECGKTEKIASSNTDADGNFSFNADISAAKTYCVKANNFASCFRGSGDRTANISAITNAAYLLDKNCTDLRESETKIRIYAKLGTGEWLGELDYSGLSGIQEGLKLLSTYLAESDTYKLSEKIAEDAKKDAPEFEKFFNGFRAFSNKTEIVIGTDGDSADFGVEGGSSRVAPNFQIVWTLKNKTAEAATYKFTTSTPGEYVARARLTLGTGSQAMLSQDSATVLFWERKNGGTVYVSDTSKNISFRIDDGIYGVIPRGTTVKKNGKKVNSISYTVLSAGGPQISRLKFEPEGAVFEGDTMYFVHELGTVFGGDPIMLSAKRTNADGSIDVLNSAAGDPIMMAAGGDPIMTTAMGDPIMQAAGGDPIMGSAMGDPIMMSAGGDPIMMSSGGDPIMGSAMGDPIMQAAGGDPIMGSAMGDPIMGAAMGDPIMMGTSSSAMISQTNHYSTFTVDAAYLPVPVDALVTRWCDGSFYRGYSPIEFIRLGVGTYKPDGAEKTRLLSYLNCEKFGDLGNDLYELINKPVGFQRNLNLFENLFFVSEFYNRMSARRESNEVAAVRNGLELRSAIAALYTATTSYNRSATLAEMFDPSMIPLTYNGNVPADYTAKAKAAAFGNSISPDRYIATKKEMMIFANYITTSSKGPDFSAVSTILNPDQLVCAWFNPETPAQNCNKVYTINDAGHVTLGGTEVSVAEANAIFTKYFMPMNTRLNDDEKLHLFRTLYLALKYAGTIFYNGADVEELNEKLLETAYLVFDGIDGNANAVTITDTFDASAHTVSVLDGNEMATRPYIQKLSALTDKISLKVAAESANVEKVLINIEGHEFEKVQENTRTYYKPTGDLKEKSMILAPGTLAQGEKALKELLGSENVDELGSITGKMTIVVNSKIGGKNYTTQRTYEFFANDDSDGVSSKPVPASIRIFVNDSTGHPIDGSVNPTIILNPGNKVFYPEDGVVSIENLAPAAYTVDAFAEGYYAKRVSVNAPEGAAFSVEIRLDEELTSSADASLELSVNIATAKHPSKVYIQIYNDDMELVANEAAKFNDGTDTYDKVNIEINSGRYTLLAIGEDLYNYVEALTLYEGDNAKSITVVAKNACGNGIVDSAEECEPLQSEPIPCGTIYPASTYPEKTAVCDPATCTFDKTQCGKAALCGDRILDAGEGCDGGAKDCSEIAGFGNSKGSAPCAADCSGYITANNCSKSTASCGTLPANAQWNDGTGTFEQKYNGTDWLPAAKTPAYGLAKDECTFSCKKGSKWDGSKCDLYPLSLGRICTGETGCFDSTEETVCSAYGEALFGQDAQYMEAGFCTEHDFATSGSGDKTIVTDKYTHYEWLAKASENAMDWDAADEYCSGINNIISGSTAVWRLPSPAELLTIVNSGTASPALGDKFTTFGHTFWAKEDAKVSGNAWRISETGALTSVAKTENHSVICVRIHDYAPVQNHFAETSETVKDNESGLMWQKQPVASRTWAEALNYCEEVSTADKFDWRLPNRNELASLINYEKANGAASDFPAIAAKGFWTSTTDISSAANAWTVDFAGGAIEAADKTNTKYIICVRNDDPCFGDECPDTCSFAPCKNMENSTGLCTAGDYDFTCGCKSGFNWNHAKCLLDTTRYIACTGLPENAVWNTVFGISQSYNGDNWYPSEVGSYNKIASSTECRFVCATNYKWDAENEVCVPESRMVQCSEKKPYSDWNSVSRISQTWNGEAWEPSSESKYNEEASEEECRFICKEHYNWDAENNLCDPDRQPAVCLGLPANAHWWNEPSITQTWTNGGWAPSATGSHSTDAEENKCYFTCDANYEWNDTSCVAKTQTANCDGLPDNAEWNGNTSITQTWDGTGWFPSNVGTYNPEANTAYCRYKCKENYNWNGSACVPATHIAACVGLPEHALWNTVSSVTQTYMNGTWAPSTTATYRAEAVDNECHFVCMDNYNYDNTTGKCNPVTKTADCIGLPSNASWINSAIAQTWTDNGWIPAATGHHKSISAEGCSFDCNTNYEWDDNSASCVGAKHNGECTGLPANAQWVGSVSIQQTWNGSSWLPELTGSYGEQAVANECRFKCKENYTWNGNACAGATRTASCATLPENTVWNTVSTITQTYNGNKYLPDTAVSYCAAPSTENCCYKCAENYTWNGTKCIGATRENQACTGLPANAEWWNGSSAISQTWNGTEWLPKTSGNYSASAVSGECRFKCSENFTWNGTGCVGATRTDQQCGNAPANATWQNPSISQTWTLVGDNTYDWRPTLDAHHKSVSEEGCSYVCNENFTWNGTACVGATRIENCTGLLANTQWNTVSSIKQTYTKNADNTYGWSPSNVGTFGAETTEECHFKCKEYYEWKDGECKGTTKPDNACTGLPLNAEWVGGNTVEQTWNGTAWEPSTEGHHDSVPGEGCVFTCKTNYTWMNNECKPNTRNEGCTGLPTNAQWLGSNTINQTWNGTAWLPELTGSYSDQAVAGECRFGCKENYTWNGTSCVGATKTADCNTKPENTVWNTVAVIMQTYNGSDYAPSTAVAYSETPSTENCYYKCAENYTWNGSSCVGATRENQACTGLPANAEWRGGVTAITQTWNGSEWINSTVGSYSENNDATHCYFKCQTNFRWDGSACVGVTRNGQICTELATNAQWLHDTISQTWTYDENLGAYDWRPVIDAHHRSVTEEGCSYECKENFTWNGSSCVGATRIENCTGLGVNAVWNTVSSIKQTWTKTGENSYDWSPSTSGEFGSETTTECHFKCKENYTWNAGTSTCEANTQEVVCEGLIANADWVGGNTVSQTWDGFVWDPTAKGHHKTGAGNETCAYECVANYTWDADTLSCKGATQSATCTGKPENNASWHNTSITQTWNGSAWLPTEQGSYSQTNVTNECRFYCDTNYIWNGSSCEAAEQIVSCGTLPANAVWNTVSQIKQTWNGSAWEPAANSEYNNVPSETECRYTCKENYEWNNSECVAKTQTVACTGLPANAQWFYETVEQTWNGTTWHPATTGIHASDGNAQECRFHCIAENDQYKWDNNSKLCVANTKTGQQCTDLKDHAHWNQYSAISQTWNGTEWFPPTAGTYSATADETRCYFTCDENYEWDGTACVGATKTANCTGLPDHAVYNTVSSITQIYNGTAYMPELTASYCDNASTEKCCFKCLENYTVSNDQKSCVPATRQRDCTGLPDNAEWNSVESITQTWSGSEWLPSLAGLYGETPTTENCRYKCRDNYMLQNGACVPQTRTTPCDVEKLPKYAVWNVASEITQTYTGSGWTPSVADPVFNTESSTVECRFKCKENYTWNEENGICVADTRIAECTGRPAHSIWNEVPSITQTWNGRKWLPDTNATYNVMTTSKECYFICDEGYYFYNDECVAGDICDTDPCENVAHSNKVCINNGGNKILPYVCGCEEGYYWNGKVGCTETKPSYANICTYWSSQCYDKNGEATCPNEGEAFYGQDAQYAEAGFCVPYSFSTYDHSYENDEHKTVVETVVADNNTGLEWQQDFVTPDIDDLNLDFAESYCEGLNYGGHDDWRLPSIKEWQTLHFLGNIPVTYFPMPEDLKQRASYFFSSTKEASDIFFQVYPNAVSFHMSYSFDITTVHYVASQANFAIRCVRGDEIPLGNNFEEIDTDGDGQEVVVKDSVTNLYWQKDSLIDKTWEEALAYCENLNYAGYRDWRLPNIRELASIVDYSKGNPVSTFPGMPSTDEVEHINETRFWSSSNAGGVTFAYTNYALFAVEEKGTIKCVRSDMCGEGLFWNGSLCLPSPCASNPCASAALSDGICTPISETKYTCGCNNEGTFWNGSECIADPCAADPCMAMSHATGKCEPKDSDTYSCECEGGYFWNGSICKKTALGNICTGAYTCIDFMGERECPAEGEAFYGQDAQYAELGVCVPKDFSIDRTVPSEKTVIDNNLGLEWQQTISEMQYDWAHAVAYCSDLVYGGHDDWRLPTLHELVSIADIGGSEPPLIDEKYFPDTPWGDYYEYSTGVSTLYANSAFWSNDKYAFYYSYFSAYTPAKESALYVRCVRGTTLSKPHFVKSDMDGDVVVTDTTTGFIWMFISSIPSGNLKYALDFCESLNYAGYTDWRLPNINELISIHDPLLRPALSLPDGIDSMTGIIGALDQLLPVSSYLREKIGGSNLYQTLFGVFPESLIIATAELYDNAYSIGGDNVKKISCVRGGNISGIDSVSSGSCHEIAECKFACSGRDRSCQFRCDNIGSHEGKAQYNDVNQCIADKCGNETDYAAYYNCVKTNCSTEVSGCYESAESNMECSDFLDCSEESDDFQRYMCYDRTSSEGRTHHNDWLQCVTLNCSDEMNGNSWEFTDCQIAHCREEGHACATIPDNVNCKDLTDCYMGCGSDEDCPDDCYYNASNEARNQYNQYASCYMNNCMEASEDEILTCLTTNCQTEYETCYGN